VFGLGSIVGCGVFPLRFPFQRIDSGIKAFKRSGRKLHASNAANSHNANHVYPTRQAALADPAHPGDRSKVVEITVNRDLFEKLFANGKLSADLRHDL